jgi:hypothetical protein
LAGNKQEFSLFLQTGNIPKRKNLYWIGGEGNWNDTDKWSYQSGGDPAGVVPGHNDHVVIDNNSFSASMQTLLLNTIANCYTLTITGNGEGKINLGDGNLSVISSLYVENPVSGPQITGNILINGAGKDGVIWMNREDSEKDNTGGKKTGHATGSLTLVFDNKDGIWHIPESLQADRVVLKQGKVVFSDVSARIRELIVEESDGGNHLDLGEATIHGLEMFAIYGGNHKVSSEEATLVFNAAVSAGSIITSISGGLNLKRIENHIRLQLKSTLTTSAFINNGDVILYDALDTDTLSFTDNAGFYFRDQATITIHEHFSGSGRHENLVDFIAEGSGNQVEGMINRIFCLNYLNIVNLPAVGVGVFNAGPNSRLENSPGWLNIACEKVVFADFTVESPCRDSRTTFRDLSTGEIISWNWQFNNLGTSTHREPAFTFTQTGEYNIQLTVSSGEQSSTTGKAIKILDNPLPVANILTSGNIYFVDVAARSYQWYRNGIEIHGAVSQAYNNSANIDGVYTVVISNNGVCNRLARNQIVVNVPDTPVIPETIRVFPNPATSSVMIDSFQSIEQIYVYDVQGKVLYKSNVDDTSYNMDIRALIPGTYIIRIVTSGQVVERLLQVVR